MIWLLLACTKGGDGTDSDTGGSLTPDPRAIYVGCAADGSYQEKGTLKSLWTLAYDDWGNVAQRTDDRNADGIVDLLQKWVYDDERLLNAGMDATGDGKLDFLYLYTYDGDGNLVLRETDVDVDGVIDGIREYSWEGGLLVEERWDTDWNMEVDTTGAWTWDGQGRPLSVTWTGAHPQSDQTWVYAGDEITHEILDGGVPSSRDGSRLSGDLVVHTWVDANLSDVPETTTDYTYEGTRVSEHYQEGLFDEWDPGNTTLAWTRNGTWTYDAAGRLQSIDVLFEQGGQSSQELTSQRWTCP